MSTQWYYVQGSERVGPVEQSDIENLFHEGTLTPESYVWRKGFDNWRNLNTVEEFGALIMGSGTSVPSQEDDIIPHQEDGPSVFEEQKSDDVSFIPQLDEGESSAGSSFDLHSIGTHSKVFSIKVGFDRGGSEAEYGPFSLEQLKRAFEEKRINEKTFIFTPGMSTWVLLGDFERFDEIAGTLPPQISEEDRRFNVRKPFVARLFFHDNKQVYEGICRDISVGGLQVLVSDFPCQVGEKISMNVHPDNSDYHFTASGKVVRKLEGDTGFSLRFEDLSPDAHSAIQSYINEH
jgi:hypothetical protein